MNICQLLFLFLFSILFTRTENQQQFKTPSRMLAHQANDPHQAFRRRPAKLSNTGSALNRRNGPLSGHVKTVSGTALRTVSTTAGLRRWQTNTREPPPTFARRPLRLLPHHSRIAMKRQFVQPIQNRRLMRPVSSLNRRPVSGPRRLSGSVSNFGQFPLGTPLSPWAQPQFASSPNIGSSFHNGNPSFGNAPNQLVAPQPSLLSTAQMQLRPAPPPSFPVQVQPSFMSAAPLPPPSAPFNRAPSPHLWVPSQQMQLRNIPAAPPIFQMPVSPQIQQQPAPLFFQQSPAFQTETQPRPMPPVSVPRAPQMMTANDDLNTNRVHTSHIPFLFAQGPEPPAPRGRGASRIGGDNMPGFLPPSDQVVRSLNLSNNFLALAESMQLKRRFKGQRRRRRFAQYIASRRLT